MKPSPCLSPIRVYNATLGTYLHVPCGRCDACIASKGFSRTKRLNDRLVDFQSVYFVTLTYKDKYLPFGDIINNDLIHTLDKDYKDNYHTACGVSWYAENDVNTAKLLAYCDSHYDGRVPLLSHSDCIKFKNRLRYYIKKACKLNNEPYENLYIYICAEYGPQHFRPHYHCLFGTNSRFIGSVLKSCVSEAWKIRCKNTSSSSFREELGFVDFQKVVGRNCSSYVSQYLNCSSGLPWLLSRTVFRPFSQKPTFVDSECGRYENLSLRFFINEPSPVLSYVSPVDSSASYVPVPKFVENRFVPKFVGFGRVPTCYRITLYSVAAKWSDKQDFIDYWMNVFKDFFVIPTYSVEATFIYHLYFMGASDTSAKCNLTKLWYVSRRVLSNCRELGCTLGWYLGQLDLYYYRKAQFKLKNFYDLQKDLLSNHVPLSKLVSLYYDTPDSLAHIDDYQLQFGTDVSCNLSSIPVQRLYEESMHKIVNDTTKTKKRNDYFVSQGKKRRPYLPILKSSLLKFNSI